MAEEKKTPTFRERVLFAQAELKAPKGQYNNFGKYKYRSAEDILESAKPVNLKWGLILTVSDQIELVGDRYYIKATAALSDTASDAEIHCTAYAREPISKKGMDESQITGTASSYARKYALNGLYLIDDTKDADTDEYAHQEARDTGRARSRIYRCEKCGNEIEDAKGVSAETIAKGTKKTYGKQLCWTCADKVKQLKHTEQHELTQGDLEGQHEANA